MWHSIPGAFRAALTEWHARRARDRAVRTALARFAALHPTWFASCFDATFVRRIGVDAVLAGPAIEVARSWTLQFRYADERTRERDVRQLVPVVESFTTLLSDALDDASAAATARDRPRHVPDRPSTRPSSRPCAEEGLAAEGCA